MALLQNLEFTGPIGNMSAYKMRGCKKTVLRTKGGASKEQIKTSARFAVPRLYMSEFAGCSAMGKEVRRALLPVKGLADHNISGPINKLMKVVQSQDTTSMLGKRSIILSKYPRILDGFSCNEDNPFDSLIRNSLTYTIDRATHSARVDLPALLRDINLFPNNKHPLFSLTVALGVVPDFRYNDATKTYDPPIWYHQGRFGAKSISTPWYAANEGSPATTLEITLDDIPSDASYSLVLSIGIRFGTIYGDGIIEQVKYAGAAKVLAVCGNDTTMTSTPEGNNNDEAMAEVTTTAPLPPIAQAQTIEATAMMADIAHSPKVAATPPVNEEKSNTMTMVVSGDVNTTVSLQYVYTTSSKTPTTTCVNPVYGYTLTGEMPQRHTSMTAKTSTVQRDVRPVKFYWDDGGLVSGDGGYYYSSARSILPDWVVHWRYKRQSRRSSFGNEDH